MKPQDLLNYYQDSEIDLVADQVLEEIIKLQRPQVQSVIELCLDRGISSQATTYKKLDVLYRKKLVIKKTNTKDRRIQILRPTKAGIKRIERWGEK